METARRPRELRGTAPGVESWSSRAPQLLLNIYENHLNTNDLTGTLGYESLHGLSAGECRVFGQRSPQALSWRGNRPLCVSHPLVREFYWELYTRLPHEYPELEGIFYFPGDADPELCDHTCPQCRATWLDPWGAMMLHVNEIYGALQASKPGVKFYFTVWNKDHPRGRENIGRFLAGLNPGIGLCMSLSDNVVEQRKS